MSTTKLKQKVAEQALNYIEDDTIIGIGTGSTVNCFIELLANIKNKIQGAVASSNATHILLKKHNIPIISLNSANEIPLYIDGADEANDHLNLIKGGGGALTGEKIIAAASKKFICIIDHTKLVKVLGKTFPLPIEVIPIAQSYVARQIVKLGGQPILRSGFTTDHKNIIIDAHNLDISNPNALEQQLDGIAGIVSNGLFAKRPADILLIADEQKTTIITHEDRPT